MLAWSSTENRYLLGILKQRVVANIPVSIVQLRQFTADVSLLYLPRLCWQISEHRQHKACAISLSVILTSSMALHMPCVSHALSMLSSPTSLSMQQLRSSTCSSIANCCLNYEIWDVPSLSLLLNLLMMMCFATWIKGTPAHR